MWLVAKTGFYSIVFKAEHGPRLTIRARVRQDLISLKRFYLPKMSKIIDTNDTNDYRFRAFASRQHIAQAVGKIASEINYGNFKDEVKKTQGTERASAYMRVWSDLLPLQEGGLYNRRAPSAPFPYLSDDEDEFDRLPGLNRRTP